MIASARMTNEELFLARRLAKALGIELFDVLPRPQRGDGFLISEDGNPNTIGAKLIGLATGSLPGNCLRSLQRNASSALLVLGEDALECGISEADLKKLDSLVVTAILPDRTTASATVASSGRELGREAWFDDQLQRPPPAPESGDFLPW